MTSIARSQRLVSFRSPNDAWFGPSLFCPVDRIILVKNVSVWNNGATASIIQVSAITALSVYAMAYKESLAAGAHANVDVWIALNPGDQIAVYTEKAQCFGWVSGAVLNGGPTITPATELSGPREPFENEAF